MKTPKEINAKLNETTDVGALQLAKFLQSWGGIPDKDFVKQNEQLTKEEYAPHKRCRVMLASAYDWFAYGN